MANTPEPGPTTPQPTGTEISVQDNVTNIPINKNDFSGDNVNAFAGTIGIKCVINGFCPLYRKFAVDNAVVLNHETLKTMSENERRNFNSVPGLNGIYLREKYNYLSNYLKINNEYITNGYSQMQTSSRYATEQTFIATKSVFDADDEGPIDALEKKLPTNYSKRATWRYVRHNEFMDSLDAFSLKKNVSEFNDSNATYLAQVSSNVSNSKGIHWRAIKETPLFAGEDFFITFRKIAVASDNTNIDSRAFINLEQYYFLDVFYNDLNFTSLPANSAVVGYKKKNIDQSGETGDSAIYEKDLDTMKYFDLNKQAYYIIEMGPDLATGNMIFILITQKAYPTAISVIGGRAYNLGSYTKIKGDDLIKRPKWTIQVRNHLGYLVVAFDGDTDNPWIISPIGSATEADSTGLSNSQTNENSKKTNRLVVPAGSLAIWGGNIASGFCFSPLTYAASAQMNLPPGPVRSYNGEGVSEKYELPLKGSASAFCTIADSNDDIFIGNNKQANVVYSSDTQYAEGVAFTISGKSATASSSLLPQTHFLTTGEYLKANGLTNDVLNQPPPEIASSILLKATSVAPKEDGEIFEFKLETLFRAGSHYFSGNSSPMLSLFEYGTLQDIVEAVKVGPSNKTVLPSCKTPILTQIRMSSQPDKESDAWSTENPIEASQLVTKYTENYSSSDFHSMQHTATITFLMNKSMSQYNDLVEELEDLRNRAFYIEVWGGYLTCNYTKLEENKGYKLFTGICYGGVLEEKAGERYLTCQIVDYSQILKESYIFNSPFFDGVRDVNAVYTLMQMLGFKDKSGDGGGGAGSVSGEKYGPAYLCKLQADNDGPTFRSSTLDGRGSYSVTYVLPSSYARLTSPFVKFQDGTTYWSALETITKKAGKVMFFDSYGMFHFENMAYDSFLYGSADESLVEPLWVYTTLNTGEGQMVFDVITRERSVVDIFNIIHLMTATPDRELAIWDEVNWKSLYDKGSPGFLGYKKMFMQQDGIFGSLDSLEKLSSHYKSKFFNAPTVYKFSSYGVPMRCFDIASVNGQKLIITSVSNDFDPVKNLWWQTVEGEWYGSEEDFGEE